MRFPELNANPSDEVIAVLKRMVATGLPIVNKDGNFCLGLDAVPAVDVYAALYEGLVAIREQFETSIEYAITSKGRRVAEAG